MIMFYKISCSEDETNVRKRFKNGAPHTIGHSFFIVI